MKITKWLAVGIGAIVCFVILYLVRPLFHGLMVHLFYLAPAFWFGTIIASIAGFFFYAAYNEGREGSWWGIISLLGIVFGLVWIIGGFFTPVMMTAQLHHDIRDKIIYLEELPQTSTDNFRMMPYAIAENNAKNTLTYSRYRLGELDFVIGEDGKLYWNAALVPEGVWNTILKKPRGVVYIDATTSQFNIKVVDKGERGFPYSDSLRWADNIKWRAEKLDYWATYSDPYYLLSEDGEIVVVVSKTKYRMAMYGKFFPIMVPYFAGVYLFFEDRSVRWVPADKIDEEPLLANQQVFPEELARRIAQSFRYPHSIANTLFKHQDQYELADVPEEGNQFPYFIMLEGNRPVWFIALEPWGTTFGLKALLFVDARTGEIMLWQKPPETTIVGAVKALEYIKSSAQLREVKWGQDGFIVIEPLPVFRKGVFWWKATMTRANKTAVTSIVFCNAMNPQEIVVVENSEQAYRFIRGEEIEFSQVTDFSEAIAMIDEQIEKIESMPEEFRSPAWEKQLSILRAIKRFLVKASQ